MKKIFGIVFSVFRLSAFMGLILWAGQLQLGNDTVGGHFVEQVHRGTEWGIDKLKSTELYSRWQHSPYFPKWLGLQKKQRPEAQTEPSAGEKLSAADRESLIKLLP